MTTWFKHWKKGRGLDIEVELKASRPTPNDPEAFDYFVELAEYDS